MNETQKIQGCPPPRELQQNFSEVRRIETGNIKTSI
jgi:hypothetical protein